MTRLQHAAVCIVFLASFCSSPGCMSTPEHPTISLADAAQTGNIEQLKANLYWCRRDGGCDVNAKAANGWIPLLAASAAGQVEAARLLLNAGARVDVVSDEGNSPLMLAAVTGRAEMAKFLIGAGSRAGERHINGRSVLSQAVFWNQPLVVKVLVDAGADPNEVDKEGYSLLYNAALVDQAEVVKVLLDGGANPNVVHDDLTPLIVAADSSELVGVLLRHGASVKGEAGAGALFAAIVDRDVASIRMLLEAGADPDTPMESGKSPLGMAEEAGLTDIVAVLRGHRRRQ